jgi:L-ascorbate metabolism protein UlaG (beta-lactamase superfamily)
LQRPHATTSDFVTKSAETVVPVTGTCRAGGILDDVKLNRLGHAAVLVETARTRVLIDPGVYSDTWHALDNLDAVLVTHQHPDHVDVAGVHGLIGANPGTRVLSEAQVAPLLAERRLDAEVVTTGTVFDLGDIKAEVVGGTHAEIHARIPRVGNVGYLLSEAAGPRFFHPGDAYDTTPPGVDILAVPLAAPWASAGQTADFLAAVGPSHAFPIHDGALNDDGRALYIRVVAGLTDAETTLHHLDPVATLHV